MAIATLTIDINAKLANIEQDLGRVAHLAEQSGKRMQSAFDGAKAALGGLVVAGGLAAIANGIRSTADFADEMGKAAQKVGSTAESLSELKHAADLSDVSFEQLQVGLGKLAKNAEQFRDGSKDAVDAFSKIGLDPTKFRDTSELFGAVAEKLSKMEDGARKTAIAQELLGKSGAELIPLLNAGADGLAAAAEEARKFGVVISEDAARSAEEFNDNLTRMASISEGFKINIGNALIPSLVQISEKMVEASKEGGVLYGILKAIGEAEYIAFNGTEKGSRAKRLGEVNSELQKLSDQLQYGVKRDGERGSIGITPGEKTQLRMKMAALAIEKDQIQKQLDRERPADKGSAFEPIDIVGKAKKTKSSGKPEQQQYSEDLARLIKNIQDATEPAQSLSDKLQAQLDNFGRLDPAVRTYLQGLVESTRAMQEWNDLQELQNASDNAALADLEAMSAAEQTHLEALRQKAQGYQELLDPTLKLLNLQAELNEMVQAGILTDEEAAAALKKLGEVRDEGKDAMDDLRRAVEGFGKDAASALVDFATSGKTSFGDMVDSWLKSLARLAATRAFDPITKQLDQGFSNADFGSLFSGSTNYIDGKAISGDVFSNLLSGARAFGGPVSAGNAYLVGERGPEVFMPGASGNIVPNHALGGNNVTVHIDARGADSASAARIEAIAAQLPAMIKGQMIKEMRPGGVLA